MIDHVSIAVTDLEESIKLYSEALGFRVLERRTTRGDRTGMISAVLSKNGSTIVLIQGTEDESQVNKFIGAYGTGVQHLAISVTNIEQALGKISPDTYAGEFDIIEGEGIRQVFLKRDIASGVRLELIERNGGTFNDASVNKLFKSFEEKDLF